MNKIILNTRIFFFKIVLNPIFIIKIEKGIVTKVHGTVKNGFLSQCVDIMARSKVRSAMIYAVKNAYEGKTLKTLGEITGDVRQQLRNVYSFNS